MSSIVLIIGTTRPYGGARVAIDLAQELAVSADVLLVTYQGAANENRQAIPREVVHRHVHRRFRGPLGFVELVIRIRHLSAGLTPNDCIIGFMTYANAVAFWVGWRRCAVIATEHTLPSIALPQGIRRWVEKAIMLLHYPFVDKVVCVSHSVEADLRRFLRPFLKREKTSVIYNPIRVRMSVEDGESDAPFQVHPWLTWPRDWKVLCIVGQLKPVKDHEFALAALGHLPEDFRLIVVGDGHMAGRLRDLVAELDLTERVSFVGWQANPARWIELCDALICTSRCEGFGLAAAEARLLGRPVIARAAPGVTEVLSRLGGRLVCGGPIDFARAVPGALADTADVPDADVSREFVAAQVADRYLKLVPEFEARSKVPAS
jgi:glycosyltransferase involved in cell wall biosynthesis